MVRGLPNRPLSLHEMDALTDSDALRLAVPATPESHGDEGGETRTYDLLLFLDESVAVVAYDERESEWVAVANESGDADESAIDALLEYRNYDLEREDDVREFLKGLHGITEEELDRTDGGSDADDGSR